MARTKQTARVAAGGKAPRKTISAFMAMRAAGSSESRETLPVQPNVPTRASGPTVNHDDIEWPMTPIATVLPTPAEHANGVRRRVAIRYNVISLMSPKHMTLVEDIGALPVMTREQLETEFPQDYVKTIEELSEDTLLAQRKRLDQHRNGGFHVCAYCLCGFSGGRRDATEIHQFGPVYKKYTTYKRGKADRTKRDNLRGCLWWHDSKTDNDQDKPPVKVTIHQWKAAPKGSRVHARVALSFPRI